MKQVIPGMKVFLVVISLCVATGFTAVGNHAQAESSQEFHVRDAWIRYNPMAGRPSAGYFIFKNKSGAAIRLTGLESSQLGRGMIHETVEQDGRMSMRHVMGVDLAGGEEVVFRPGGLHLMLFDLGILDNQSEIELHLQVSGPAGNHIVPIRFKVCGFAATEMC